MAETAVFPGREWETVTPEQAGFDPDALAQTRARLDEKAGDEGKYRIVVVRGGRIAAEWNRGLDTDVHYNQASAAKSTFSSLLGVAVGEGKVSSPDAIASEFYPEMLDVPDGAGPKPGRCSKPEDATITLRHLITNTSGYLKPDETPGQVYHYQTFGMNILMHTLGRIYGVYDAENPEGCVGPGELIREKIRDPIGGTWSWEWANFKLDEGARLGIFGYYTRLKMTCRDQARLGWLWRNEGNWNGNQVIPAAYVREATVTAPDIKANGPEKDWLYGHGFWVNDHAKVWPSLPTDSFAAIGAGTQMIWVCPSLDLVVAESPGVWKEHGDEDSGVVRGVVDSLK